MPFACYSAKDTSMNPPIAIAEVYVPIWMYSRGSVTTTSTTCVYLPRGSSGSAGTTSPTSLLALSTDWSASQKFVFEVSIKTSSTSGITSAVLYDVTAAAVVPASQITTASTTAVILRSGPFTLIPGHVYTVGWYTSNASYTAYINRAELVALGG